MNTLNKLLSLSGEDILAMQHVKRWHMVRTHRTQTLAEHVGSVALLSLRIARIWDPALSEYGMLEIVAHALVHDAHEVEYGDPPSPAVAVHPEAHDRMESAFWTRRLEAEPLPLWDHARRIVTLADKLEALMFYQLEGEDQRLKDRCEMSVEKHLESVPLPVAVWVRKLVASVKAGGFTPQPAGSLPTEPFNAG